VQKEPEPEPIDRRPLMKRLWPEDDHHAGEPGQRDRYLSRDPERFIWFHHLKITNIGRLFDIVLLSANHPTARIRIE
jgi:hypothetical protein